MWEPMAKALGYPKKAVGFDDILKLASSQHRLGPLRAPGVGQVQARPHQPGLLDLRPERGRRRVLRGDGQEGGADRGRHHGLQGAPGRARDRALDRPLRRHDAVHLRPDAQGRPGLRVARWRWRRRRCWTSTSTAAPQPKLIAVYPKEGTFYSDNPFIVLDADWVSPAQKAGAQAFQRFLAEGDHARRSPPRAASGPASPDAKAVAPDRRGPRRRSRRSPSACSACPSRACWPPPRRPGAPTASRPTSCSSSTPRAR